MNRREPRDVWAAQTEKADMSWENIFRFTFQRNFIPVMKGLASRIGEDKLIQMLEETTSKRAKKGMAANKIPKRDLATWTAQMRRLPPFREEDAAGMGYAAICYPDYAVASGFNPKLKLVRTKTLMQGHECCNHRYVMES
jgi:hypothetical protein